MNAPSVESALATAVERQPDLNAFISIDDEAVSSAPDGPLGGVPIALKDIIDHAGQVTTCGSAFYRHEATATATSVQRLIDAGGVIVGRANLHEWAFGFNSENQHWGPVRNPWDTNTSAGGSSGGSGAAVAAGIVPLAIGTDTGGSVRVPATLCGTYGLKVTYGAIPTDGVFPLVASIDTVGPLAASMELIETAYRVMAADHRPLPQVDRLRIGIPQPWVDQAPMSAAVKQQFGNTVERLRGLGHEVSEVQMNGFGPSRMLIDAIGPEVASAHRSFRQAGNPYGDAVQERIETAERVTEDQARVARQWQDEIRTTAAEVFTQVDVLTTPTVPDGPKVIGEEDISGRNHRTVLSYFTAVVNHALLPALAAPIAGSGTPPASIQLIGDRHSDLLLVGLGLQLQDVWHHPVRGCPPKFTYIGCRIDLDIDNKRTGRGGFRQRTSHPQPGDKDQQWPMKSPQQTRPRHRPRKSTS